MVNTPGMYGMGGWGEGGGVDKRSVAARKQPPLVVVSTHPLKMLVYLSRWRQNKRSRRVVVTHSGFRINAQGEWL